MAIDTCMWTCIIDKSASAPLSASFFLDLLINSILTVSILLFSTLVVVAPLKRDMHRLKLLMGTAATNNLGWAF